MTVFHSKKKSDEEKDLEFRLGFGNIDDFDDDFDEDPGEEKPKSHRKRVILIMAAIAIIIVGVGILWIYQLTYRSYSSYTESSKSEPGVSGSSLAYEEFADGYLQIAGGALAYFNEGETIWESALNMSRPIVDVCEGYAAAADIGSTDVYIFDKSGEVGRFSVSHEIIDIEVSDNGMVALSTDYKDSSYIEIKDISGNDIINIKNNFSSTGYQQDIALSEDGTMLAAAFLCVSDGTLRSKVFFYDLTAESSDDMLKASFDQYQDTVLTDVEFLNNKTVCAMGDDRISFYRTDRDIQLINEESSLDWEVQSVSFEKGRVLLIARDGSSEYNYRAVVYNASGKRIADTGFDYSYSAARLAGRNILLYSSYGFQLINFRGHIRYTASTEARILSMKPISHKKYILGTTAKVCFIRLQ